MSQIGDSTVLASSSGTTLRPPFDPLLTLVTQTVPGLSNLEALRTFANSVTYKDVLESYPYLQHAEYSIPGLNEGDPEVILSVFQHKNSTNTNRPSLYHVHGGGQVVGNRFLWLGPVIEYFADIDAVFVSVEYRLAPECPAPAALHDAYAGLVWTAEHAVDLRIDAAKIVLSGTSGGAPIAAGSALLSRDNQKSYPMALMLLAPMLDDRDCTISSKQFEYDGTWPGTTNREAWQLALNGERGLHEVSELVAPARATNLAGLPPVFIDVGECEVFRDEALAFASQLWKDGVSAELHVWQGAYHGFDFQEPVGIPVVAASKQAKTSWVKRITTSRG